MNKCSRKQQQKSNARTVKQERKQGYLTMEKMNYELMIDQNWD